MSLMGWYATNPKRHYRSGKYAAKEYLGYAELYRAETPEAGFRNSLERGYRARKILETGVRSRSPIEIVSRPSIDKPQIDEENSDVFEEVPA